MGWTRIRIAILVALLLSTAAFEAAADDAMLRLSGVLVSSSGRSALINGQVLEAGDWIEGVEIVSIESASVMVRGESEAFELRIGSAVRPEPRRRATTSVQVAKVAPPPAPEPAVAVEPSPAREPVVAVESFAAREPVAAAESSPSMRTVDREFHRVAPGETLSGIAMDYVGPGAGESDLAQAMVALYSGNPGAFGGDMNLLFAGARLRLPTADALRRIDPWAARVEVARQVVRGRWHAPMPRQLASIADENRYGPVEQGETLSAIAARVRSDGATLDQAMMAVFDANPEAFGGNVNLLYEGVSLRIPPADASFAREPAAAAAEVAHHMARWRSAPASTAPSAPSESLPDGVLFFAVTSGG